jgi:amino acid permease
MSDGRSAQDEEQLSEPEVGYYNPRPEDPPTADAADDADAAADGNPDAGAGDADVAGSLPSQPPTWPPPLPSPLRAAAAELEGAPDPFCAAAPPPAPTAPITGGASASASVALLCNSAVGAGVLALPYALARAGLVPGLVLCLVFCLLEAFTLYTLAKFAERYRARTYGQLVRRALGKRSAALLSASVFLLQWGACVAYLVIIGDAFSGVIDTLVAAAGKGRRGGGSRGLFGGHHHRPVEPAPTPTPTPTPIAASPYRTPALLAVALGIVFPLCLPADLAALEAISAAAVAGFAFTSFVVCLRGWQRALARPVAARYAHVRVWRPAAGGLGLLDAIPLIVFGFNSHANVVTIFHELEAFPKAPRAQRARAAARRAAAAVGGLGSRVGSYARSLAALGGGGGGVGNGAGGGGGGGGGTETGTPSGGAAAAVPESPAVVLRAAAAAAAARAAAAALPPSSVPATPAAPSQPPAAAPSLLLRGVRTKKLFGMVGVIAAAMVVIAMGYVFVAVAGLVGFPPEPPSNILNAFSEVGGGGGGGGQRGGGGGGDGDSSDPLVTAARLVIGLVVVAHYPLAHHPAREALGDLADAVFGGGGRGGGPGGARRPGGADDNEDDEDEDDETEQEDSDDHERRRKAALAGPSPRTPAASSSPSATGTARRVLSTALFVLTTLATALACDLGGVLHLLGGTVASCLIFGIPGLLLINASIIKMSYYAPGGGWGGGGDEERGAAGGQAEVGAAEAEERGGTSTPLLVRLPKKAGLRERGLVYSPGVSWASGVALLGVCLAVMGMTVASALT